MPQRDVPVEVMPLGLFDDARYAKLALQYADEWRTAQPFPHVVIDNFLDHDVACAVERDFPLLDDIEWGGAGQQEQHPTVPTR